MMPAGSTSAWSAPPVSSSTASRSPASRCPAPRKEHRVFTERVRDLAHVGSVELFTPVPDESLRFFVDLLGMDVTGRRGDSVYLHAWDDYERFTIKLTASSTSGIGRTYLRAAGPDALQRRVDEIEAAGLGRGWASDEL